jgi:hypothetical protein
MLPSFSSSIRTHSRYALPSTALLRRATATATSTDGPLSDRAILYISVASVALLVVSIVGCIVCCKRTRRVAPSAAEGDEALRAEVVELRTEVAKLRAVQQPYRGDGVVPPPLYDAKADGMV